MGTLSSIRDLTTRDSTVIAVMSRRVAIENIMYKVLVIEPVCFTISRLSPTCKGKKLPAVNAKTKLRTLADREKSLVEEIESMTLSTAPIKANIKIKDLDKSKGIFMGLEKPA